MNLQLWIRSSVQVSHSVVSDSLQPHELQHTRPPCPSPTPRVHPNPCPLSRWCHPTISSSVIPSIFPSIRVFSNESAFHILWPKYWSFSFNISSINEHPGLISWADWGVPNNVTEEKALIVLVPEKAGWIRRIWERPAPRATSASIVTWLDGFKKGTKSSQNGWLNG